MAKKGIDWRVVVAGLLCITFLEAIALINGVNGILFTGVIAIIGAVIGVTLPNPLSR